MLSSSLIAVSLLFLTYVGLCLISARHGWALNGDYPPEQMLSSIAIQILGPSGGCIAAVAVITACLTTAITLASISVDYLRKDLYSLMQQLLKLLLYITPRKPLVSFFF